MNTRRVFAPLSCCPHQDWILTIHVSIRQLFLLDHMLRFYRATMLQMGRLVPRPIPTWQIFWLWLDGPTESSNVSFFSFWIYVKLIYTSANGPPPDHGPFSISWWPNHCHRPIALVEEPHYSTHYTNFYFYLSLIFYYC